MSSSVTVLVVDDTPANLEVICETLGDAGYEVITAIDGDRALKRVQTHSPDLILLDVQMPGIDGFETCQRLKADLPNLLTSMQEGVNRICNISTSLRTFSRADCDRPTLFNIHDGIDSTLMILQHRLKANEFRPAIEVIKQYADIPQIECYVGQLNQVFMNILANAIDALEEVTQKRSCADMTTNSHKITISTQLLANSQHIQLRIQDNGIGMSPEVKQRIFDYLFTTKEVGKGTGLGLAIAHQIIIEKHNGSLDVNSLLGQGTEFIITLPIKIPVIY